MTSKTYLKNREDLIGLGALYLMYFLLIKNIFFQNGSLNFPSESSYYVLLVFTLLIRIIPAYYAFINSKEMNRDSFFWIVFVYVTPFWGLVFLSKLNYAFPTEQREEIKPILNNYKAELKAINVDWYFKNIDRITYRNKKNRLELEFNKRLAQKLD